MFLKRLKAYRFQYLTRISLFFVSFLILLLYSSVCFSFYESIFLYSAGYQDDYAYATTLYSTDVENIPADKLFYAFDIRSDFEKETAEITGFCSTNIMESKGFFLYGRAFVTYEKDDFHLKSQSLPDSYCLTTHPDKENIAFEGKSYPVYGNFSIRLSQAMQNNYSLAGVKTVYLNLIIDPSVTPDQTKNCFMICSDPSLVKKESYFYSGKELNQQYRDGYTLYLPLIYILFLLPLSVYLIALMGSLRQVCSFELREGFLFRCVGLSRSKQFGSLFMDRFLSLLIAFALSLLFIPFVNLVNPDFYRLAFSMVLLNFAHIFFGLLFLTIHDLSRVYQGQISFLENHYD